MKTHKASCNVRDHSRNNAKTTLFNGTVQNSNKDTDRNQHIPSDQSLSYVLRIPVETEMDTNS